jgi:anti-sigma B factor antagonist
MELSVEHVGDVTVAKLCVESLTANNAKDFGSAISNLLGSGAKIVLDMGSLEFIDSSGIGALMACIKKAKSLNGALRLCAVTRPVRNLLALVRVDRFVQVFQAIDDAVRSFDGSLENGIDSRVS